ncbi:UDP-N-acetylmuramoyl-L-alanyl-D-glutamate--2,6-diaminopimelate ligase [Schaalia sp. lx-100]|uniref:UDP-N-acetylmuramoyl-L-alanyl-D-glutamate--2, 6-diaminopimelate ligase n=1 Tax=Schaalia sp. lx-100 TaxID=2899081 RepID=UPI001E403F43|nr:UDP-N-acetylmuramoyl-L-alanyl-D-glutamate--2,6-diaminopimelate ligase [Schaalia sp. lx-100]MCD4557998.1 UDP-N-acetylmuramoyl-L-alanyl-D-glutamate--2,6-diaminopimelate ligase [Schaalia sp. lx-100]
MTMTVRDIRPDVRPLSFSEAVSRIEDATLVIHGHQGWNTPVSGVTVNSSDIEHGWIFVAVAGLVQHGASFFPQAVAGGAVAVVTDSAGAQIIKEISTNIPVVVVQDPRFAAATIASVIHHDPATRIRTLAVTGTNGKTTTTYLMRSALRGTYPDAALCGTVQTHVGDVEFLSQKTTAESPVVYRFLDLAAQKNLGAAIVETSSHALSLGRVHDIIFDVAVFTNLQHDHLDYYGDMENYFEAKKELFTPQHARFGVICVDDVWGQRLARETSIPHVTYAAMTDTPADWCAREIHCDRDTHSTIFTLQSPQGDSYSLSLPILGSVNVQNAVAAFISALTLGLDIDEVIASLAHADQIPGRMEIVNPTRTDQPLVIVDFAHTPEGLEWTLRTARDLTTGRVSVVFGTDGERDPSKREDLGAVAAREADVLWVTDENPRYEDPQSIRNFLLRGIDRVRPDRVDVTEVSTCRRDAVRRAILQSHVDDIVMITGKGPEWYQEIEGIKHAYSDTSTAREILQQAPSFD